MADPVIEELLAAREHHRAIAPPSEQRRLALAEAYAVQDRLREALVARGERVIGWKAGFTSKTLQAAYGCEEEAAHRLLAAGRRLEGCAGFTSKTPQPAHGGAGAVCAFLLAAGLAP